MVLNHATSIILSYIPDIEDVDRLVDNRGIGTMHKTISSDIRPLHAEEAIAVRWKWFFDDRAQGIELRSIIHTSEIVTDERFDRVDV